MTITLFLSLLFCVFITVFSWYSMLLKANPTAGDQWYGFIGFVLANGYFILYGVGILAPPSILVTVILFMLFITSLSYLRGLLVLMIVGFFAFVKTFYYLCLRIDPDRAYPQILDWRPDDEFEAVWFGEVKLSYNDISCFSLRGVNRNHKVVLKNNAKMIPLAGVIAFYKNRSLEQRIVIGSNSNNELDTYGESLQMRWAARDETSKDIENLSKSDY